MNESQLTEHIRLAYAKAGVLLWRNNVGVAFDKDGRAIRYGLANESRKMNKKFKSSDLIGIMPVKVTIDMVDKVIGQFIALEVKGEDWTFAATEHEIAQNNFLELVSTRGGYAAFVNSKPNDNEPKIIMPQ